MKKLYIILAAVLSLPLLLSCSDDLGIETEVNNGQDIVTTGKLQVTGTINKAPETRMSFADGGTSITPSWEVDDQVFGFWGENTLTYRVASIDADGVASFTLVNGNEPTDGTTVHMIYAPSKSVSDLSSQQLAIDLSQQDGTLSGLKNHAIMCATATVSGSALSLQFENQVAIVGVKQFTGLKASTTYTSATFTSAGPTATVKVEGGVLKLVTDDAYGTITATGSFASDASGNTTSTIYFAVPATGAVGHQFTLVCDDDYRIGAISAKAVEAGKYLYMTTKALRECVDLGLPSHTLWAATNVGASSPDGFGDYYAWGEVETQSSGRYWWDSYKWGNASSSNSGLTKYNSTDGLTRLLPEDDAATVNWKNSWRIPTKTEFDELINTTYTTSEWTTLNGISGMRITSKVNGKSIFLPAAGLKDYGDPNRDPGACNYASSDLLSGELSTPYNYKYNSNRQSSNYGRCAGRPVRAVIAPMALPTTPILSSALVQHWTFDGNTNNSVTSISASMTRTAPTLTTDRFGNENSAYNFGGNGGMLASGAFEFGTSSFSANVWVCTSTSFTDGHNILRTDDGYGTSGCFLRYNRGNIQIWEGRSEFYEFVSPNTYNDGVWHMLTYVRDVENRKGQLYVDGDYVGGYTISGTINNVSGNLRFGNVDGIEFYTGKIDDVRLYNIALSPTQIVGLYTTAPTTPPAPPTPPTPIAGTTGSALVTVTDNVNANAHTSCDWVQLWAGGPKWATFNVGASATTYAGMTEYSFANTGGFYSFRGKRNLYPDAYGASSGDTATDLWGTNWRTPTSVEEQALMSNCDFAFCDGSSTQYETGCTLKGWKVTGRGDYAGNSIFLPLAGVSDQNQGNGAPYYYNEGQKPGNGGWYWASDGSNRIYLSTTSQSFASHDNPHGCSVRAVLKENN